MAAASSWFDRGLKAVAPGAYLKRTRTRAAIEVAERAYAAAAGGRNVGGWKTGSTSADAEIYGASGKLRDRSRDLVRNNAHAAKAVTVLANNIVGEGIMPRPKTGNPSRDAKLKTLFNRWAKECDADGQLDFYGLQTLACREMVEGGEVMARRRRRRVTDKMSVPLQIQLLEADFLDDSHHGIASQSGGMSIQGIEFDQVGRRSAYWLFAQHPGNNFFIPSASLISKAVPASEVLHVYEKQRTQARGVPWGAPVVRSLRDLDDYEFAEIIRKKIESSSVGVVTTDDPSEFNLTPQIVDTNGKPVDKFSPGQFLIAKGGKDIKFNAPAMIGGYAEYKSAMLHTIAAGFRVPYELLTGDLSQVNYSSIRASLVEFRRFVRAVQWHVFIPMFLQPLWDWFVEAAYLAGEIDVPTAEVEWSPPKFEWVDPYKDALAELLAMRSGTRSYQEVVGEHGRNPEDVLAEIAEFNATIDKLGLILDSDPRQTSLKGVLQKLQPNDQTPDGKDGPDEAGNDAGAKAGT